MSCSVISNNISSPELRDAVSKAVCDGIGERGGEWNVVVYQALDYPGIAVRIEGPKGLRWSWTFFALEQAPELIEQKVTTGITDQMSLRGESE
jgi:hypothetical protein